MTPSTLLSPTPRPSRTRWALFALVLLTGAPGCFPEEETEDNPDTGRPHICEEVNNLCGDAALREAGAQCLPDGDGYTCLCPGPGLRVAADGRCEDVRECDEFGMVSVCGPDAMVCTNTTGSFSCRCNAGFVTDGVGTPCRPAEDNCEPGFAPTGDEGACEDIDECDDNACGTGATSCTNRPGSFECRCGDGYVGGGVGVPCTEATNTCERGFLPTGPQGACEDINECGRGTVVDMCGAEGRQCMNVPGTYTCLCNRGYKAPGPEEHCAPAPNTCETGYLPTGVDGLCEDIHECTLLGTRTACGDMGRGCTNRPGAYECDCGEGYRQHNLGEPCLPAQNICQSGYEPRGTNGMCLDTDECSKFGRLAICGPNSTSCSNRQGTFECICQNGYVAPVFGQPCQLAQNNCPTGYAPTGMNGACQNVNECLTQGVTGACGENATQCLDRTGSFECVCASGYRSDGLGLPCRVADNNCLPGYLPTGPNGACQDVNECTTLGLTATCGAGGANCYNRPGTWECGCQNGFVYQGLGEPCAPAPNTCAEGYLPTGANGACQDVNECSTLGLATACGGNATGCNNRPGSWECLCPNGYTTRGFGWPCELATNNCNPGFAPTGPNGACQDINECVATSRTTLCGVANAGCTNSAGSFACQCPTGYTSSGAGTACQDVNECQGADLAAVCGVSTATCQNLPGTFSCTCPTGFRNQSIAGNTTGNGTKCIDIDECAEGGRDYCPAQCNNDIGSAECVSTVADPNSPYWPYYCWTPDDRYIENATDFELDCRCGTLQMNRPLESSDPDFEAMMRCDRVGSLEARYYGTGISVQRWRRELGADTGATRWNGGYLDHAERKIYMGAQWKDNTATDGNPELTYYGAVLAVDVNWNGPNVGNRTLVSGHTLEGDRGTGPTLRAVQDIKKGPDGKLYTVSYESGHPAQIMRIDQATGNRTLVWKAADVYHGETLPASQCHNGSRVGFDSIYIGNRYSLQYPQAGTNLTMAENGDFFFPIMQSGPAKGPKGIVRIKADGSLCEWVTRFAATGENTYAPKAEGQRGPDYGLPNGTGPRGAGPINYSQNPANIFYRRDANDVPWIYVIDGIASGSLGNRYYRVNVETGDRFDLFSDVIGDTYSEWDPHRQVLWTAGAFDRTRIVAVDLLGLGGQPQVLGGLRCLATNSDWYQCMRGPGDNGNAARSDVMFDPFDNNLIMVHERIGLVRVEVRTGNTYVFSK